MYNFKKSGITRSGKNLNGETLKTADLSFPLEVFPPLLQAYAKSAHNAYGTSIEHLAAGVLFAASAAVGRTHLLELMPGVHYAGRLLLVLVGAPGINKGEALRGPLAPIFDHDDQQYHYYKQQMVDYEAGRSQRKVGQRPTWQRILVQDLRPQVLSPIYQRNQRGIALHRQEFTSWFKCLGRKKDRNFWLPEWEDELMAAGRLWNNKIYLEHPFISVAGTIRPAVLKELVKNKCWSDDLVTELLFAWPNNEEKPLWTLETISEQLLQQYHESFDKLLDLTFDAQQLPHLVKLTEAAREMLIDFFNQEQEIPIQPSAYSFSSGVIKWQIHTARFCLLLQLLWWAFDTVEKDRAERPMVERAIQLTAYFQANSRKVFHQLIHPAADRLSRNKRKIYEALPHGFTTAQGVAIAHRLGMRDRTFKRWLNEPQLFVRVRHGHYEKVV